MILKDVEGTVYSFHFWLAGVREELDPDTTICVGHPDACKFRDKDGKDVQIWPCDRSGSSVYVATHCSQSDDFNHAKGKRVALGRAMRFMGLNRGTRTQLWREYHKKIGMPK